MKKAECRAAVTLEKFTTAGWTSAGNAAKKALGAKPTAEAVAKLKKDSKYFKVVDLLSTDLFELGSAADPIIYLLGLRQILYSQDLANFTAQSVTAAVMATAEPRKKTADQKAAAASWKQVIACFRHWIAEGELPQKMGNLSMADVAAQLYLHPKAGNAKALPANWEQLLEELPAKLDASVSTFDEIELE